ncbi:MAG: hypothetical protein GEU94_14010 [Micromonosporaceae bacterium]|nr:hypothetical protein [Micromonosporaceae bacterium]
MSEAFPRKPAPRHAPLTPEEIEQAKADFALHIPSLFTRQCIGPDCGETWPCRRYTGSVAVLDRAGLLDVNGQLRDSEALRS